MTVKRLKKCSGCLSLRRLSFPYDRPDRPNIFWDDCDDRDDHMQTRLYSFQEIDYALCLNWTDKRNSGLRMEIKDTYNLSELAGRTGPSVNGTREFWELRELVLARTL